MVLAHPNPERLPNARTTAPPNNRTTERPNNRTTDFRYARFLDDPGALDLPSARAVRRRGREVEIVANGDSADVLARLKARSPEVLTTESLTLEEIFVSTLQPVSVPA